MSEKDNEEQQMEYTGIRPEDIGEKLRKARSAKGLSIEDIQKQTKLRKKYIESIEQGDFGVFPGKVYAKGAIRNYAEIVNYDFHELWEDYERIFGEEEKENKKQNKRMEYSRKKTSSFKTKIDKIVPGLKKAVVIVVILAALGYGLTWGYDFLMGIDLGNDEEIVDNNDEEDETTPIEDENDEDEEEPEELEPTISVEKVDENPATFEISGHDGEIELLLEITESCWVSATLDGEQDTLGTLEPGFEESFSVQESAEFVLGYAYGANFSIDDIDIDIPETQGREDIIFRLVVDNNDEPND